MAWYLVLAALLLLGTSLVPNLDAIAYIQVARHYLEGRVPLAVNGCWGPGLSWIMIPFLALGFPALTVARGVCLLGGLLRLVAGWWLGVRLGLRGGWLHLAMGLLLLRSLRAAAFLITPDGYAAAFFLALFTWTLGKEFPSSRRQVALAGCLGAIAFYFKAFALPFTVSYIPLVLWLRRGEEEGIVSILRRSLPGWGAFFFLVSPWILILSSHYDRPLFSTSGAINHAIVAPNWPRDHHPAEFGLRSLEAGRLHAWEEPSLDAYPYWSPFASVAKMRHQVRLVVEGVLACFFHWKKWDLLGMRLLVLLGVVAFTAAHWMARWRGKEMTPGQVPFADTWVFSTLLLYHGGYLPMIGISQRYFLAPLTLLTLWTIYKIQGFSRTSATAIVLGGLLAFSLGLPPLHALHTRWKTGTSPLIRLALELRTRGLAAPVASTNYGDSPICLFLDRPFLGTPLAKTAAALRRELEDAGVGLFLAWGSSQRVTQLEDQGFLHKVLQQKIAQSWSLRKVNSSSDAAQKTLTVYQVEAAAKKPASAGSAPVDANNPTTSP
jgi:hypothetical protein